MQDIAHIFKTVRKWLVLILLCIMGWQQWTTFAVHQEKFLNPVEFTKNNFGTEYITVYENRFHEIKKMFPFPAHLTYFGDGDETVATGTMHYSLTQYYLSPNLLFINKSYLYPDLKYNYDLIHDTLIYNLYRSGHLDPATNFHLNNGWHILKDFDNGLIILTK